MSDVQNVQFDEDKEMAQFTSRKIFGQETVPGMSRFLIKIGLAKTGKQAEHWMIAIVCICLLIIVYSMITLFSPGFFGSIFESIRHIGQKNTPINANHQGPFLKK